jgi:hypothetical protein
MNNINKVSKIIVLMLIFIHLFRQTSGAETNTPETSLCDLPYSAVTFSIVKSNTSPEYSLQIKNNYNKPISAIVIGDVIKNEIQIEPDNIPTKIYVPTNWKGQTVFGEESEYMSYYFETSEYSAMIKPGAINTEIKLVFIKDNTNIYRSTYTVYFNDGKCYQSNLTIR